MGNLTASMIREHPALAAFQQHIQDTLHVTVRPGDILLSNERPGDGVLELSYMQPNGNSAFVGILNASQSTGALRIRRGEFTGLRNGQDTYRWNNWENHNVASACNTVRTLGGEEERQVQCNTEGGGSHAPVSTDTGFWTPQRTWLGNWALGNYTFIETVNFLRRWRGATAWHAQSPTMSVLRNGRAWMTPVGENRLTPWQRFGGYGTIGATGALTMFGSQHLADAAGLHPDFHANEHFAIGSFSSYGAMAGMTYLLNRRSGASFRAPSLAAGLISSALVDATLGQMWAEGSGERQALRSGAFFLPQLYRMAFGTRSLALTETRAMSGLGRWANRAFIAGALADGAYMVYDHAGHSNRETARSNLIHRRANQLFSAEAHPLRTVFNGAVGLVAPALSERFLTPDSYVSQAQTEIDAQSSDSAQRLRRYLGQALLMGPEGPATDASFYTQVNWDWLRGGDGRLHSVTRNGRELPVDLVADQLSVPEIHQRVIENSSHDEQIAYVQQQFRGYDLSRQEVEEIFARIALHNARQEIRGLYYSAGAETAALSNCFDQNGSLLAGRESELMAQVFPGQDVNAEQVLALRRVALARRILELRQSDPAGQLAAYDRVAREIGLIDAGGNLVGEETRLAQASLESHPPAIPPTVSPAPRSAPSRASVIQGIMAYGARG
ncbi:MAG TPA: hypothetical protein VJR29_01375 [bacterium]|nr:hypothetical protein [bacterium]